MIQSEQLPQRSGRRKKISVINDDCYSTADADSGDVDDKDCSVDSTSLAGSNNQQLSTAQGNLDAISCNIRKRKAALSLNFDGVANKLTVPDNDQERPHIVDAKYEYLDHTADVQVHTWGNSIEEAFEWQVIAMFNYMTDLTYVSIQTAEKSGSVVIESDGLDIESLLYNFLNECLIAFMTENFVFKTIHISFLDLVSFKLRAEGFGEQFDLSKHKQGTEVKAITYSAMQIRKTLLGSDNSSEAVQSNTRYDVYVILDI